MVNQSCRPHHSLNTKVGKQEEQFILTLRKTRNLGARRIQSELKRLDEISLSLATVHKVLQKHGVKPITFVMPVPYWVNGFRRTPAKSLLACTSTPLGSPHLNGKVERSQQTDRTEFYATVDLTDDNLDLLLAEWQHYYNWDRPHSAHHGKSPMEHYFQLSDDTPYSAQIHELYEPSLERIQHANY